MIDELKIYIDDEDEIQTVLDFINKTKDYKKVDYILVFIGKGSNGKTTLINYIRKYVGGMYHIESNDISSKHNILIETNCILDNIKYPIKYIHFNKVFSDTSYFSFENFRSKSCVIL